MSKTNEVQELLDGRFPDGAVVTFSDGSENMADYFRMITPRLMVVRDDKIIFFALDSRRDFTLTLGDVEEDGDFVILKGASPSGTDVSIRSIEEKDVERVKTHREDVFDDDRLASMRDFER